MSCCVEVCCKSLQKARIVEVAFNCKYAGRAVLKADSCSVLLNPENDGPEFQAFLAMLRERGNVVEIRQCTSTYMKPHTNLTSHDLQLSPSARSWFKATEYASIYGIPAPDLNEKITVGVVSFGGGLYGNVSNGILTSGDCKDYWTYLGIPAENHPVVKIVGVAGATNTPSDGGTDENTLDVQMIGACCPSANLTIILYLVPNTLSGFVTILDYMLNTPVDVNGQSVKPDIISISWGAPEIYYSNSLLSAVDARFQTCMQRGIPVTAATGDNGSKDGVVGAGNYCDFPSSSPNLVACGGTRLVCPNYVYDGSTVETAWSSGGGAISRTFFKPTYQSGLTGSYRQTPDIALNADPATGVVFLVNGQYVVYGGTSVVAPALAGYFAATKCRRFPNTLLYGAGRSYYNDITSGSNGGYNAAVGYDNCTGLGSIKGAVLKNVLSTGTIPVASVSVAPTSASIIVGNTTQLTATVLPSSASNKSVSWSSNAPAIATVSSSGLVTGVAAGSASITVTTVDGSYTASSSLTVTTAPPVLPRSISLNRSSLSLSVGQTNTLIVTFTPSNTTNKSVTWTSSSPSIASVSSSGVVSALRRGTTTIVARSVASSSVLARCTVTVR